MRAGIYCRISQDRSGEEAGVTRQLEDCRELVARTGWELVDTYIDNDISAAKGKTRPEYRRMLADLTAGTINAIVVWNTDRLYRKITDLEELLTAIEKNDVTLRSVRAGEFDLGTGTGRMLARIMVSVAQGEGDMKSERWRRSVRQRREQGLVHNFGPRLFGYHRDGSINPDEADTIRWAAAALIEGESARSITRKLNNLGIRTTLGNSFSLRGLNAVMQNRRLTGASMLNGDVVGIGQWEPILDEETFEQVQAIYTVRRTNTPRAPRVALLVGLIHCGLEDCGAPLSSARRNDGTRIYRCAKKDTGEGCARIAIRAQETEQYVEGIAQQWLEDQRVRDRVAQIAAATGGAVAEVLELETRLRELEQQLDEPGVPVASITRAMQRTQERINKLHASGAAAPIPQLPAPGNWPTDLARRAQLVRIAVNRIDIHPVTVRGRNTFDYDRIHITPN